MPTLERFGVSMEEELLSRLDAMVEARGYSSRSEAIRDLVRREIVQEEWADPDAEVIGTITIVYEHQEHDLAHALTQMQHAHHDAVICCTHVHMDPHNCLEVIIVRGSARLARQVADTLISARGVKHGQLVCTTTGKQV